MTPPFSMGSLMPGDAGITQTVNAIRDAVHFAVRVAEIRQRAESIVASCPERDEQCEIVRIFEWAKAHFRYVRDIKGLEFVKSPEVSDREISIKGKFQGDCDDITAYVAALLTAIGYSTRAVVIAPMGRDTDRFSHIYLRVYAKKLGRWISLEGTGRAKKMGWTPPAQREKEYDL